MTAGESVLSAHPMVREAVAMVQEDFPEGRTAAGRTSGDRRLVAYVSVDPETWALVEAEDRQGPEPSGPEDEADGSELGRRLVPVLRNYLGQRLPEPMVPSRWVVLDALPRSPTGKVERGRLPAPDGVRPELERAYVAPRSPQEEVLARIWCEVLGVEQVGIHDDFFELGGHSLLALQLVSRVRDAYGVEIGPREVFNTPVLGELLRAILELKDDRSQPAPPPIVPVARAGRRRRRSSVGSERRAR